MYSPQTSGFINYIHALSIQLQGETNLKSFDAQRAYGFMETLVKEIGNRESATDREAKAAEKIKSWFNEFGLSNVKVEEFDVRTSHIRKEEVSLPDGTKLGCSAVGNTLSTPPEGVEGEVVHLDSLSQDALKTVEGKIVAVGMVLYKKDFRKILAAKPLALIYPSRTPLAPKTYRSVRSEFVEESNVPAVSMAHDDVLDVLKGEKRVRIVTELENVTAKSRNVTGEVSGSIEDEDVLVCGHYDTVRSVMGAHDNAAGVAVMLELARIFAGKKLKRTLRVAAFGSEELGLRGSFEYAKKTENVKGLRLCLDYDVHGILLGNLSAVVLGSDELKMLLSFVAKELGIPLQVTSELGLGGSDHMPLAFYGVPSVMLSRGGGAAQIMHTDLEDLRWCGVEGFASVGSLSERLLERLLMGEELPFDKKIPEQIAKALEKRFEDSGVRKEAR
jgi:acetylornithine deacetylase/succinyl-diaminopimelate desuccinylase-like protein